LVIRLFEETPSFKHYIAEQNRRCKELFTALPNAEEGNIITSVLAEDYQRLYEFAYIQRDTRLNHTLVFQVDEFWMMKRPGIRRSGASRPAWDYLHAKTSIEIVSSEEKPERIWAVDPFGWFQKTMLDREENTEKTRLSLSQTNPGISSSQSQKEMPYRRSDDF